jgi:hypothetical protein
MGRWWPPSIPYTWRMHREVCDCLLLQANIPVLCAPTAGSTTTLKSISILTWHPLRTKLFAKISHVVFVFCFQELGIKHPLHRKKLVLAVKAINAKQEETSALLDHIWVTRKESCKYLLFWRAKESPIECVPQRQQLTCERQMDY